MTHVPAAPVATGRLVCRKKDCLVASGGLCLDGFEDPSVDCEAAITFPDESDLDPASEATPAPAATESGVVLYHGDQLSLADARTALGSRPMRIVSLVGELDAGKTTLLASIFEMYQVGAFAGCTFAGTHTPIGLDKRCFYSRTSSGLVKPTTRRTQFGEGLHFLHLALKPDDGRPTTDTLIADRSGEWFELARRTGHDTEGLSDLPSSVLVLFLVNGRLLLDKKTRNGERHRVTHTARSLFESGLIREGTQIAFVLTKMDLIIGAGEAGAEAGRIFDAIAAKTQGDFGSRWPMRVLRIAARAEDGSMPLGEGLEQIVRLMVEAPEPEPAPGRAAAEPSLSAYDLFARSIAHGGPS